MQSSPISAGDTGRIGQYNDLRDDVIFNREKVAPQFTASFDIPAQSFVGVSEGLNNSVFKANNSISIEFENTAGSASGRSRPAGGQLSDGRFFYVYSDGTSELYAFVGQVEDDGTILKGDEVTITTGLQTITTNRDVYFSATQITDSKFIVFYTLASATNNIYYRVYDTTGVEITTEGSEGVAHAGSDLIAWTKTARLEDDVAVLCYELGNSTEISAVVVTITGTDVGLGVIASIDSNFNNGQEISVSSVRTDGFVIYRNGNNARFQAGSISGTTITMGVMVTDTTGGTNNVAIRTSIVSPSTDVFVARLSGVSTNSSFVIAGSVSGNTITLGTAVALTPDANLSSSNHGILFLFDGKIYANSSSGNIASFTLSGTTIENMKIESITQAIINTIGSSIAFVFGDRYGYINTSTSLYIHGNSNGASRYIGYVKDACNKGDVIDVITSGVVETTDIVVGQNYAVLNGGLTPSGTGNIIGVSDTQVIL